MRVEHLIDKLEACGSLTKEEFILLLNHVSPALSEYLFEKSRKVAHRYFGSRVYTRGLIEFTNYCKNDCFYCGIRAGNHKAERYRLSKSEILSCCANGYSLGFRTFVLQGGEDCFYSDGDLTGIISEIKAHYPDCALTLSVGERNAESYEAFYKAGADRYLLRHETADAAHYQMLHPKSQTLQNRKQCLWNLKDIGYQVGTGFMVGSPFQTAEHLAEDFMFIQELSPQMIGIGPFVPHHDTPFADYKQGSLELTLFLIGLLRLLVPNALIPAKKHWVRTWLCQICRRSVCVKNMNYTTIKSVPGRKRQNAGFACKAE